MGSVDRTAVIAEEQRAVDHAYDCAEQDRRRIAAVVDKFRSDCPDAGLSSVSDVPAEFGRREELGRLALVTMRVDLTDDPDGRLTWYLGRRTVRDNQGDLVVVKWTNPQATRWRLATPDNPEDVRRLRTLRCDERTVLDYSDREIQPPEGSGGEERTGGTVAEPGQSETADPFLLAHRPRPRRVDARHRGDHPARPAAPGVGRAQRFAGHPGRPRHRQDGRRAAPRHLLLDNKHFTTDEVLVVGPHRRFLQYVKDVLPRLGSRGVTTVEISQLWEGEIRGVDTPEARLVKSDGRMAMVLRNAVEGWIRPDLITTDLAFAFKGAPLRIARTELEEAVREARDSSGPYLVRRRRFIDRLVDLLMQRYAEATRLKRIDEKFRAQAEKQSRLTALLNAVWPSLTAERALRQLLGTAEAVRTASFGLLTSEEQLAIVRPPARRTADEPWTSEDLVCLEELRFLLSGEEPQHYRHIVVDEAQDLTPMQARSLARRCPRGSMTILGDVAQATGSHRYDVCGRLAGILAGGDGWHMAELTIGYRVPAEVMAFAKPLAAALSSSTAFPASIRPPAADALTVASVTRSKLVDETVSRALNHAVRSGEEDRSIAIIVPGDKELLDEISGKVAIAQSSALPGLGQQITVLPAPLAKGLEFDHVIVVEPQQLAHQGPSGLRQLYVAITRCTQSLTVLHSAPLPVELGGPARTASAKLTKIDAVSDPAAVTALAQHDSREQLQASLRERISADRRHPDHGWLRHTLVAELFRNGLQPSTESEFADITCKTERGTAIYVVMNTPAGTYAELREAAVRALETEWACGKRADEVFLVLPEEPQDLWAVDILEEAFKVSTIWKTQSGWGGPHGDIALGAPAEPD